MDTLKKAIAALDEAKSAIQEYMGNEGEEETNEEPMEDEGKKFSFDKPKEFKGAKRPFN